VVCGLEAFLGGRRGLSHAEILGRGGGGEMGGGWLAVGGPEITLGGQRWAGDVRNLALFISSFVMAFQVSRSRRLIPLPAELMAGPQPERQLAACALTVGTGRRRL
jgi:hypothetical protein